MWAFFVCHGGNVAWMLVIFQKLLKAKAIETHAKKQKTKPQKTMTPLTKLF